MMDGETKILPGMFVVYVLGKASWYYLVSEETEKELWVWPITQNECASRQFFWTHVGTQLNIVTQEAVGPIPEWIKKHMILSELEYEYV